jgi:raffinose/stachyose/melibiose transport system substrate-binding protein
MKRLSLLCVLLMALASFSAFCAGQQQAKAEVLVWDEFNTDQGEEWFGKVVADFQTAHPNITIKREPMPVENMRDILKPALAAGTGPDLFITDVGPADGGALVKDGLVLSLDSAYAKYGWDIFNWAKTTVEWKGQIYGVPQSYVFIGMYYNKDMLKRLGGSYPQSHAQLLQLCEQAKAAGQIPVAFANQARWPATNVFSVYANCLMGKRGMDDIILRGQSWDRPEIVKAVTLFFVDMNKKGYLTPSPNGISYGDGNLLFWSGKGLFQIMGSWLIGQATKNATFDIGFSLYPPIEGKPAVPPAAVGYGWYVSKKAKYPDQTISLLNAIVTGDSVKRYAELLGDFPAQPLDTTGLKVSPLYHEAAQILARGLDLGYNIDTYTPGNFNEVMYNGFQQVLNGDKSAAQLVKEMQAAWQQAIDQGQVELQ